MDKLGIKAITVCVGYDDFLQLTIKRTLQYVDKFVIVTTPEDTRTQELVAKHDKAECFITDAFYRQGASFNKGWALEEGFDALGRDGWLLILDADILLPETLPSWAPQIGKMYTPPRRIMTAVDGLRETPYVDINELPIRREHGNFGYFQLFHATDPALTFLPWYETTWVHAAGADSVFEKRWVKANRLPAPFEVIHLGETDQNWYGRVRPRLDDGTVEETADARRIRLEALQRKYGWAGKKRTREPVAERLGQAGIELEPCHDNKPHKIEQPDEGAKPKHHTLVHRRRGTVAVQPTPNKPKPPATPPLRQIPPKPGS